MSYSTVRVLHKVVDESYFDGKGRIKPEYKFKITIPELKILNSEIQENIESKFKSFLFLPEGEGRTAEGGLRKKGYFKHNYKLIEDKWFICDFEGNQLLPAPEEIQRKIKEYVDSLSFKSSSSASEQKISRDEQIKELPLITVVTVVLNGAKYLEQTIQSVINQTYPNVEYIIIDGGSSDGTLDIIRKYEDYIDYWVSEKDKGVYDAMNKGIDLAIGEWINFMNAGDGFYDVDVLAKIFANRDLGEADVIYGNHQVIYPNRKRIAKAGNIEDLWKGSQFCHQSSFVSAKIQKKYKFNITNRIGADFEFFYTLYRKNMSFKFIDIIVANYTAGGLSDIKRVDSIVGRWNVIVKDTKVNLYYIWLILKEMLKSWIKKVIKYESH